MFTARKPQRRWVKRLVLAAAAVVTGALMTPLFAGASTAVYYWVHPGDTLSGIAYRYHTTWQTLASWNHLANPNYIVPGQRLLVGSTSGSTTTTVTTTKTPVIVSKVQIGTSVKGRDIWAYQIGDPKAAVAGLVIGQIHGDEKGGVSVVSKLMSGHRIAGIKLWVIPTANPDGYASNTRYNARHVDLNRNFGTHWVYLNGPSSRYYQGPSAFSEPESKALAAFMKKINPKYVAVIHQPLNAVDADGVKNLTYQKALVRYTGLPSKALTCSYSGGCVGTSTLWVNKNLAGSSLSVELPSSPSSYLLSKVGTGIVTAMGGR